MRKGGCRHGSLAAKEGIEPSRPILDILQPYSTVGRGQQGKRGDGRWQDQQLLSEQWIDFIRTPAPATAQRGHDYGGQWWLVPDDRKATLPKDAFAAAGNRCQYVNVAPSHDLVIVRKGLDFGGQGFNPWDLLGEVLKAVSP